jgi:aryl-alcohol dehydrogenase-like predicted oxidoreductase/nucleoside-diphosphate-sugar epimerase
VKVLVVGGVRFVGRAIVNHLLLAGHEVTVLALDPLPEDLARHAEHVVADRNDPEALARGLQDRSFDAVVDNIAYHARHVEILAEVLRGRFAHYVLTSSVDVYGVLHPRAPREDRAAKGLEDHALTHAFDAYARGKVEAESAARALEVPWTLLRPGIVTGRFDNVSVAGDVHALEAHEHGARSTYLPPRVLDGGPILIRADDQNVFKLAWVRDVASAVALALVDPRLRGEAYAVTGDEVWTTERLARALCAAAGRDADLVAVSAEELEAAGLASLEPPYGRGPAWSLAENAKLKALGWRPTPAESWLPKLLESASAVGTRPRSSNRLAEIALARHVKRRDPHGRTHRLPIDAPTKVTSVLPGRLTLEASRAHATRAGERAAYRPYGGASISTLGIGTWMGDLSRATDAAYVDAIVHAVLGGLNVIDTAINYRHMLSERVVGRAVRRLVALGVPREALFVATKGGFVTHDAADPHGAGAVPLALLDDGARARSHCIDARFLENQLHASLGHLGLATVDMYWIHNPEVARAAEPEHFERRLYESFVMLEGEVRAGRVAAYGLATWEAFRVPPGAREHVSLERVLALAHEAGGEHHHLRAVQMPLNAASNEAIATPTQAIGGALLPAIDAAAALGLAVFASGTLGQGSLHAAPILDGLTPAEASAQAVRSAPGVTCALVGMRQTRHVAEMVRVATRPLLDIDDAVRALTRPR